MDGRCLSPGLTGTELAFGNEESLVVISLFTGVTVLGDDIVEGELSGLGCGLAVVVVVVVELLFVVGVEGIEEFFATVGELIFEGVTLVEVFADDVVDID